VSRTRITFLIVNRRARRLSAGALLDVFRSTGRAWGDRVRLVETSSVEDLEGITRTIAEHGDATVVFAGGDGSYMEGVTALARAFGDRALPKVAFAPGGTVCTVARNWGLRGDHVNYARTLIDAIANDRVTLTRRPTLRVSVREDGPVVTRIGFIVGAGLVSRFFEEYEAAGAPGYGGAAKIVARVFGGSFVGGRLARRILTPVRCTIEIEGVAATFDRTSLFCASVVRNLGLGMRLLYRAGERADRFHVVATPLGPARLGPQMPLVLAGRSLVGPRIDALVREALLRFPTEDAYVLDGELFRAREIRITPGPEIDLLTPDRIE
jgi:diacylglycerol kinase family enzyme